MGPIGRDAFTAAELKAFWGAASGVDDEEGGLARHVGNIADLAAVRRPAGGGFDIAIVGNAFRMVGRKVVAIEIDLVAEAEGEADELAIVGEGGGAVEAAGGGDDSLDVLTEIDEHNMQRIVFGERIDHGVGVAPARFRGDGAVLREDFEACAIDVACADFATVLIVGQDEGDLAVAEALDVEKLEEDIIDDLACRLVDISGLLLATDGLAAALEIQSELVVLSCGLDFELSLCGLLAGQDSEPSGKCEHPFQLLAGCGITIEGVDAERRVVGGFFPDICALGLCVGEIDEECEEEERCDFSHVWTA